MSTQREGSKERNLERGRAEFGFDIPTPGDAPLLTDPVVIEGLLRQFLGEVLDVRKGYNGGLIQGPEAPPLVAALAKRYAGIFAGDDPNYSFTDWNSPEQLGVFLSRILDVDAAEAIDAFFLKMAAGFIADAVIPFEDDEIDMEATTFRIDVTIEDAVYALRGLHNSANEEG